ncbi:MAG: CDP-diacylglycerol--serine O-phosphatidyltransferase [Candidatus Symbiothrix sp.]|jgi:CDP-diacylglycerol--serine O-phosphatidyltransferase|nr:CDP-diacylglycerol--serine O-phosphatidyltransferase [Candidatus Symbiothrix sp.]
MKNVPNIITCLNLFAGCLSCIMTLEYGNYTGAFLFIVLAAVFDFLDGFAARLLKAYSPIGAQLDSLADVISFGLAPGFVVYSFLTVSTSGMEIGSGLPYLAFLIPAFSALRLAKFNIDTRQTSSFLGLPVPANGLFWAALVPALTPLAESDKMLYSALFILLIIVFCLLMVSELPMFSLKFKNYTWKDNRLPYLLILSAIICVACFRLLGISLTIIVYILISSTEYISKRNHAQKK